MTDVNSVFDIVRELILELTDVEENDVTLETTIESLSLDSLDFVEMQVVIKKKISVVLVPESFANSNISTLRQLWEFIVEQLKPVADPV